MDFPFLVFEEFSFTNIRKLVWESGGLHKLLVTLHMRGPTSMACSTNNKVSFFLTETAHDVQIRFLKSQYLVGRDHRSEELRVFAVERIGSLSLTNRRFEIPSSFNFEKFSESAFSMIGGTGLPYEATNHIWGTGCVGRMVRGFCPQVRDQ